MARSALEDMSVIRSEANLRVQPERQRQLVAIFEKTNADVDIYLLGIKFDDQSRRKQHAIYPKLIFDLYAAKLSENPF
jgi:hypothetical protein